MEREKHTKGEEVERKKRERKKHFSV